MCVYVCGVGVCMSERERVCVCASVAFRVVGVVRADRFSYIRCVCVCER